VARKQMTSKQQESWLWFPLIIGLIIGVTVAASTGQWWWSTIGVLGGALVGAIGAGKLRWPGSR
jgi:Na+/H+-dicarboxylate symporter